MVDTLVSLKNPIMEGIGPVVPRSAQQAIGLQLPEGTTVVSSDGHWEITEDIFYDNFPAHMKEQAPRVWFDKYWHIGYPGKLEAFGVGEGVDRCLQIGIGQGAWDAGVRIADLDIEGVYSEIVFPQSLLGLVRYPDLEVQRYMYQVYNEYMAQRGKETPGRFHGVGIFSNWWDPAGAEAAMQQIVDLGLKTFMLPISPGKNIDGKLVSYGDPEMERLWEVIAAAGLPVNFHIGENPDTEHRGGIGTTVLVAMDSFRKPLGQLIFGGVFDRHPDLKVVFTESGISWLPPALQDAEMIFDTYGNGQQLFDRIDLRPSDYWHRNCYATFQNDLLGLRQLDIIGADRVMWGSDYPHSEGSYGFTWSSMKSVVDNCSADDARKILGGTAIEVYGL